MSEQQSDKSLLSKNYEKPPLLKETKYAKIWIGIYIANERRKKQGGRIRCPDLLNKIEIYSRFPLHYTEVYWIYIRRKLKGQPNKSNKKSFAYYKNIPKYKSTTLTKYDKKDPIYRDIHTKTDCYYYDKNKYYNYEKNYNKRYSLYSDIKKENEEKKYGGLDERTDERIKYNSRYKYYYSDNEKYKKEESDEESSEYNYLPKEIIIGKIVKTLKIIYKTKPFVGILRCEPKKKINRKVYSMQALEGEYFIDVHPVNPRLYKMEILLRTKKNYDMLKRLLVYKREDSDYVERLNESYVVCTFDEWGKTFACAVIHKVIGTARTIEGECNCFLYEHSLNNFYYYDKKETIEVVPSYSHRVFSEMVFTIDPSTSTDLDDALSIRYIEGGLFEVGVHIADVSSFLHLVYREYIERRTTSVYLPHKVFHMLPSAVVRACSLDPRQKRLAFSVLMRLDAEGRLVGESRMEKLVVCSAFKLSYAEAQDLMTQEDAVEAAAIKHRCSVPLIQDLRRRLLALATLAQKHRQYRVTFEVFENEQLCFYLDAAHWPVDCKVYSRFHANKVVEEFMVMANVEAAKHLLKQCPEEALVIHHPPPGKLAVKAFHDMFPQIGKVSFASVRYMQKSLFYISKRYDVSEEVKKLCYFKARRCQEPAIYRLYKDIPLSEDRITHFALGLQFYTHFTSPMRRMADIIVHYRLSRSFSHCSLSFSIPTPIQYPSINQYPSIIQYPIIHPKIPTIPLYKIIYHKNYKKIPYDKEITEEEMKMKEIQKVNDGRRSTKRLKKDLNYLYLCLLLYRRQYSVVTEGLVASLGLYSISIYLPEFDMTKYLLWKQELKVVRVSYVYYKKYGYKKDNKVDNKDKNKEKQLDVCLFRHPSKSSYDIYWRTKAHDKVVVFLSSSSIVPLHLQLELEVTSEAGPYLIKWKA